MAHVNGHDDLQQVNEALQSTNLNGLAVHAPRPYVLRLESCASSSKGAHPQHRRRHSGKRTKDDAEAQSFMLPGYSTSRPTSPDLPSAPPTPHSFVPLLRLLTSDPTNFTNAHVRSAFHHMATEGGCTGAQVGAFLTALKLTSKDRESGVVAACADVMRRLAISCDVRGTVVDDDDDWICDIVGTGGDGHNTYNVSTTAAIVAAGAGARVCKVRSSLIAFLLRESIVAQHGNRASSSASGAADLLSSLDVPITTLPADELAEIGQSSRFLFLYAPLFHPSMALVGAIRRELNFPTIFNTLGPLINPARPDAMVLGVHSAYLGPIFVEALRLLGVKRAWVVCGEEGLDEISPEGPTHVRLSSSAALTWSERREQVWEVHHGRLSKHILTPVTFGLSAHPLSAVKGGTPAANAALLRSLLDGEMEEGSPIEAWVAMNAAALLVVGGKATTCVEGVAMARESIRSGKAKETLETFGKAAREVVDNLSP